MNIRAFLTSTLGRSGQLHAPAASFLKKELDVPHTRYISAPVDKQTAIIPDRSFSQPSQYAGSLKNYLFVA